MNNQFEFRLPNGSVVRTGNQQPERIPTSFAEYPETDLLTLDEIREILNDPQRPQARDLFGSKWILNQGKRSSCNAYAVAGCLSRVRFRMGLGRVEFGPEFLYALINQGQDRGSMLDDGMLAITEHGICPRQMIPYEAYQTKDVSVEARRVAKNYRAFECYQFPTQSLAKFWQAMISAVCRNELIVLAVHVGDRFLKSGEFAGVDRGPGNHAVGADDARIEGGDIFDIKLDMFNSWGLSFGEKGRTFIGVEHMEEPMKYHAMYAMRSATLDPEAENPFV